MEIYLSPYINSTLISATKSLVSLRPITLKLILANVIGFAVGTEIKEGEGKSLNKRSPP